MDDFPDELLLKAFRKLTNIDGLYSLFAVNQRLTGIVRDAIFVSHLTFDEEIGKDFRHPLISTAMLNRLCGDVLPQIASQVHRFDLQSSLVKKVFHAAHHPNLSFLGLSDVTEASLKRFFSGKIYAELFDLDVFFFRFLLRLDRSLARDMFKNPIQTLQLTIIAETGKDFDDDYSTISFIAQNLFEIFSSLNTLIVNASEGFTWAGLSFENDRSAHFYSSTLPNLKITVENFDDCCYLFDGRFSQLERVDVTLCYLSISIFTTKPKLVCRIQFSFSSKDEIILLESLASNETLLIML